MRVQIEIDVNDCRDCPFKVSSRGQGECWEECRHKDNGQEPYENILWGCQEQFKEVPEWCPLGLPITQERRESKNILDQDNDIQSKENTMSKSSQKFEQAKQKQRELNEVRIRNMQAKIQLGTAAVIAGLKKLPFEDRFRYCMEIMGQYDNPDYDADGRYLGSDPVLSQAQAEITMRHTPIVDPEDAPRPFENFMEGTEEIASDMTEDTLEAIEEGVVEIVGEDNEPV